MVLVVSTLGWAFNSRVWPMLLFVLEFGTAECTKWNSFEEPKTCWKQMWYYVNTALEFKNRLVLSAQQCKHLQMGWYWASLSVGDAQL